MKRLFALLICSLILLSLCSCSAAPKAPVNKTLQFDENGEFKILQLADIQSWFPVMGADVELLRAYVEAEMPDLIVLAGDQLWGENTMGPWYTNGVNKVIMDTLADYGIPVAMVFGNHDAPEGDTSYKEMTMELYRSYDCFVGSAGETFGFRVGNYNLPILSSDGTYTAFNLYFLDSGSETVGTECEGNGRWACVPEELVNWYVETSNSLKEANGGNPLPSINFQHIIVPEIFEVLTEAPDTEIGWTLPEGNDGIMGEIPCPPNHTHGQFDAFVQQGDVIATVSGHDHANSFVVPYEGIDIINTQGCGFGTYGSEILGYRVFVLDESDPWNYETYIKTYYEIFEGDPKAELRLKAHTAPPAGFFPRLLNWSYVVYNWDYVLIALTLVIAVLVGIFFGVRGIVRKVQKRK